MADFNNARFLVHRSRHWWMPVAVAILLFANLVSAAPREVRVGVYANEPKIFLDADGRATGILGGLLDEIAQQEGWQLTFVPCLWQQCLQALQDNQIDLMPDLAYSEERAQLFGFHKVPALNTWSEIYRPQGVNINSMLDLQGRRIAVLEGSVQEPYLRKELADFGIRAELVLVKSLQSGFEKAAAREVDAVVAGRFYGGKNASGYKLFPSPVMFQPVQLFYGTRRGKNEDLLIAIDRHLDAWMDKPGSPYYRTLDKWLAHAPQQLVPPWLWWSLGGLAAILLAALLGNRVLRRKVIEQTQRLQEDKEALRLQALVLDQIQDVVTITDLEGKVTYVNQVGLSHFNRQKSEMIGQSVAVFGDDPRADATSDEIVQETLSNGHWQGQIVNFQADGTPVFVSLRTALVRDEGGQAVALVGVGSDISERRQMEGALRLAHFSVEAASDALFWIAPDARIVDANAAACKSLGYTLMELRQLSVPDVDSNYDAGVWPQHFAELRQRGSLKFESEQRRKDGSRMPVEIVANYIRLDDREYNCAFVRNIAERKQTEAELQNYRLDLEALVDERTRELAQAKDAAEAANRAKSTFLANMSHELRTPMNAIMGMTRIVMNKVGDPKLRSQLAKVDHASAHLLAVINDILDISKIEAGSMTLEREDFALRTVLDDLSSLLGHRLVEKNLAFVIDLAPEVSRLCLKGDGLRIGQILLNLTANAVKFTEQGTVSVRIGLGAESSTDVQLHFEVQDTGIGISGEDMKRLFTAFEQADGSLTRKYGGTGLGLAISKRLVELMGGDIGVQSQPGKGSTFWFNVRLDKTVAVAPPRPASAKASAETCLRSEFSGARILLAEDEPINQEVSRMLLEEVGLVVDIAADGVQALELAKRRTYQVVLMDMQMPRMNGVDAARAIRMLPGYESIPIVAMTANVFDDSRRACLEAGMNDHIGKPVDPPLLFEILLKWLR